MMITTPDGKQVPVKKVSRQAINNARKKLNAQFHPEGYTPGPQEQLYNQHWDNWANGQGNVFFQPLSSDNNIFYNPHFRHGLSALVVGGIDAVLDKAIQDPAKKYLLGGLIHAGSGFGNAFLDDFYYRLENQKIQKNYQAYVNTFRNMAKDYNGTMNTQGNNVVFTMPDINTEVTLTPEGLVSTKPLKQTTPSKQVTGKVTPYEYKKAPSSSIVSLTAVSELLDIDVPNFVRADPADLVQLDAPALNRKIQEAWQKKKQYIEKARSKDLSSYLDRKNLEAYYGQSIPEGYVPPTLELREYAQSMYDDATGLANRISSKSTIKKFLDLQQGILDYFANNPDVADSQKLVNGFFKKLQTSMNAGEFSTGDLIKDYQQLNYQQRQLYKSQAKEYKPEVSSQIEACETLKSLVLELLPADARNKLLEADYAYAAYKRSEKLDEQMMEITKNANLNTWLAGGKKSFSQYAESIYDTFGASNISEALKYSLIHDDYLFDLTSQPNVSLLLDGKTIRKGQSLSEHGDIAHQVFDLDKVSPFSFVGRAARAASGISKKGAAVESIDASVNMLNSDPYQRSPDFVKLTEGTKQQFKLREKDKQQSLKERLNTPSEELTKIYKYNEQAKQRKEQGLDEDPQAIQNSEVFAEKASEIITSQRSLIRSITNMADGPEKTKSVHLFKKQYKQYMKLRPKLQEAWLEEFDREADIMKMFIAGLEGSE